MSAPDHAQTRRTLRIIVVLAGKEVFGLRTGEIAKAINELASTTTRVLAAMEHEGFCERLPNAEERWRLGPKLVQIAQAHVAGLATIERQISEVTNRYSRTP
jgi:DNA-binding IclR family transcriptional regulator